MANLSFDTAETLIYDPVPANRTATRSVLYAIGFRHIATAGSVAAFNDLMRKRPPDLALCETQGAEAELCVAIQALRLGLDVTNPFVVIIATAWEKDSGLVSQVLNSGADDLLLRPFSTSLLIQRIETHIQRRKGFIVTSDYVGPDRRREGARSSNIELFEPPNTLKMKAKERLGPEQMAHRLGAELRAARDVLNMEKLRRDAFQVCVQWRLMQDHPPGLSSLNTELSAISTLTQSIAQRCRDGAIEVSLRWCDSIRAAVEGLQLGVDRNASMHLLGHAALSLNRLFHPEKSNLDQLAEVDAVVAMIRARNAQKLAS